MKETPYLYIMEMASVLPYSFFILIVCQKCVTSLEYSRFSKEDICHVEERIKDECSKEVQLDSLFKCLSVCGRRLSCIGASIEKSTGKCFFHELCSPLPPCVTPDANHVYYSRYCVHGTMDTTTHMCQCVHGSFGERCDKALPGCESFLHLAGYARARRHFVYIDPKQDGNLYKVGCTLAVSNRTWIMAVRNSKGEAFNRTWNEYLRGFVSRGFKTYWMGLKTWNTLSEAKYDFLSANLNFGNLSVVYRVYYDFLIGNRSQNYSFTFTKSINRSRIAAPYSFGKCLTSLQNTPFSTWDRKSDNTTKNCASLVGSGWWHPRDCDNPCNLLGMGFEGDWEKTPIPRRFSLLGINNMAMAAEKMKVFIMSIRRV